ALLVFLVCRELVCWYWKLNEITRRLSDQQDKQADISKMLESINETLIGLRTEMYQSRISSASAVSGERSNRPGQPMADGSGTRAL
ncbi:MAG: hypothetical protein R6X16_07470, partial [Anaerolineae bacterium]